MAIFKTNDCAHIHYEIEGEGRALVMLHGWDQSAKAFCENIPVLSKKYKVISVDLRGHGDSENVAYGYQISRLATDVKELLDALDVQDAVMCSSDLLINESNPFGFADNDACVALREQILTDTENATEGFVEMMLITPEGREKYFRQTVDESLKFPKEQCALLFLNHVYTDWRDVIQTITLPTLVIGAKKSHVKVENNIWTHEHIPGSELKIFETAHMMFMEEPEAFNQAVIDFIG